MRIETQVGGQLIAEGTAAKPIVFTSRADDRYGAGGTTDTTHDGATTGSQGDWGGIFFGPTSFGSLDHVLITFAGGQTSIEGGFATFDPVEIHQAQVRIANSTIEDSALVGDTSDRSGRTSATAAAIFIRGAQPVIVNNTIRDNGSGNGATSTAAAISINLNALNSLLVTDWGDSTGSVNLQYTSLTNDGPFIRGNLLGNNPINGMLVRGGTLTTDAVWDDTDIVHVLEDLVTTSNQFSLTGTVRLQSTSSESLVVKLMGSTAGFTASGTPLDINDRYGGTVQIIGSPNHPVILTSLFDATVGAGFTPNGKADNDTANLNGAISPAPTPGDWNGIILDTYSNDTNVATILEQERGFTTAGDTNNLPTKAQFLGTLAPNSKAGDDNSRLGFAVLGSVSQTVTSPGGGDVDVYSFQGTAGTTVWLDIDQTGSCIDSVVELIAADGSVIARSDNSNQEQQNPNLLFTTYDSAGHPIGKPMQIGFSGSAGAFTNPDFFSSNPLDAGMRVDLPGTTGSINTYYVRVRASNPSPGMSTLTAGLTKGAYELNIRLQNLDQYPGSVVRDADIRYAINGIQVVGKPEHSPLEGDTAKSSDPTQTSAPGGLDPTQGPQDLGNLLANSNNELSVAGNLTTTNQVVWFKFNVNYDLVQSIANTSDGLKTFAAMFSVNYADGLSRPDTTISVFDQSGNLVLIGRSSDVIDSQPVPAEQAAGVGTTDLSQTSFGPLDPVIGSVQLPAGGPVPSGALGNDVGGQRHLLRGHFVECPIADGPRRHVQFELGQLAGASRTDRLADPDRRRYDRLVRHLDDRRHHAASFPGQQRHAAQYQRHAADAGRPGVVRQRFVRTVLGQPIYGSAPKLVDVWD